LVEKYQYLPNNTKIQRTLPDHFRLIEPTGNSVLIEQHEIIRKIIIITFGGHNYEILHPID